MTDYMGTRTFWRAYDAAQDELDDWLTYSLTVVEGASTARTQISYDALLHAYLIRTYRNL